MTTLKRVNTTPLVMKSKNTPVPSISTTMGMPHSTLSFSTVIADMRKSSMRGLSFGARGGVGYAVVNFALCVFP